MPQLWSNPGTNLTQVLPPAAGERLVCGPRSSSVVVWHLTVQGWLAPQQSTLKRNILTRKRRLAGGLLVSFSEGLPGPASKHMSHFVTFWNKCWILRNRKLSNMKYNCYAFSCFFEFPRKHFCFTNPNRFYCCIFHFFAIMSKRNFSYPSESQKS